MLTMLRRAFGVISDSDSTVSIYSTSVNFNTSSTVTVTVNDGSTLKISGGTSMSPVAVGPGSQVDADYIKAAGGSISFQGYSTISAAVWNVGGTIQFNAGTVTDITNASTSTDDRSFYQTSGTTLLGTTSAGSGSDTRCEQGFEMSGGDLDTLTQQTQDLRGGSTEDTNVYIHGSSIVTLGNDLGYPPVAFSTLYIDGWGIELGGDAEVKIGVTTNTASPDCDAILSNGAFQIDGSGTVLTVYRGGSGTVNNWVPFSSDSGEFSGQFGTSTGYSQTVDAYEDLITIS